MLNMAEAYIAAAAEANKLKRWEDPSSENVPNSRLDDVFHISVGPFNGGARSHAVQPITVEVMLTFWRRGFKDPEKGRRDAIDLAEKIAMTALKYKNHIGNDVKSVILNTIDPQVMREDNDNICRVQMSFTIGLSLGID